MRDPIQPSQSIQRVDEPRDEADDIAVPAGVVDERSEYEILALVCRCTRDHCNKDNEPADLEVEQREPVECWDGPVPE